MLTEKIAIYPGTFDPITLGHIDIIQRGSKLFDRVIVTVAVNLSKEPLFNFDERMEMIKDAIRTFNNVTVESDFEYEFQMALMNKHLQNDISTLFMVPNEKYTYLNSTIVKDVAKNGGNVKNFVTEFVEKMLKNKFATAGK